jgi:hypothetical protein
VRGRLLAAHSWLVVSLFPILSCGYHVGGKADLVPRSIQTISVPPFSNLTVRYRLSDSIPNEIEREFKERTRFSIERDPKEADAVLNGSINNVLAYPAVADPTTGRTTSVSVVVLMSVTLTERATGRVLYANKNFSVRGSYAIATDPHQIFDESGPAYDRISREIARDVVSAVLENF